LKRSFRIEESQELDEIMHPKPAELHISEIIELSALEELIITLSEAIRLRLTVFDHQGATILTIPQGTSPSPGQGSGDSRLFAAIEGAAKSPSSTQGDGILELTIGNRQFLAFSVIAERKIVAYLAGGPFIQQNGEGDPKSCAILNDAQKSLCSKVISSCGAMIGEFYLEKSQARLYLSRMSTLYEIGNTVNSTLKLEALLRLVLDNAITLLGAQAGSIMLLDESSREMRIFVAYGLSDEIIENTRVRLGQGISGGVAQSGIPRLLLKGVRESTSFAEKKREEIKSAICVPLKAKGQIIGVLNVSGKSGADDFTREDMELLEIMAGNAAGAIINANLYQKLQDKVYELGSLYEIGTTITSAKAKKKVLQAVLKSARKLLKARKGSLMLLDRELGELRIEIAYGLSKKIQREARPRLGEGIAGRVALEGKPRLMQKGKKVSGSKSEKSEKEIPSAISVPVRIKDRIIGVLNVSDRESGDNFTRESMELLEMLANQAAIALENSRLYEELQELFVESISALANAIDARDPYTRGHSQRVTEYSIRIARKMGLPDEEIEYIQYAALLHDIGKINIRDDILHKPGKLSDEEFLEMQKHPVYGARIMEPVKRFRTILPYMFHHHEKFEGKGYPEHLKGFEIPLAARIITVGDSFDAMTSDRPYRKGFSCEKAVEELLRNAGTQFDPQIVEIFVKILQEDRSCHPENLAAKTI
jgi:HD-GYP domain-containing protein (c-di-GMP phosphodiesterase class II)